MTNKHLIIIILCAFVFITGCSIGGDESSGSCKFHIISYGGGFQGWYIIDNDNPITFSIDTPESSIYIFTTALSENTGSISILLYEDNDLLSSNSEYKIEDETLVNEVNYTSFRDDESE